MTICPWRRGALKSARILLSALITVETLTACHGGGSGGYTVVGYFDTPGGTLSGLVDSGLTLQTGTTMQFTGPGANGTGTASGGLFSPSNVTNITTGGSTWCH